MEDSTSADPAERPSAHGLLALLSQMACPPPEPFVDILLDPTVVSATLPSKETPTPPPRRGARANYLSRLTLWGDGLPPSIIDLGDWTARLASSMGKKAPTSTRFVLRLRIRSPRHDLDDPLSGIQGTIAFVFPCSIFAHCSTFVHWKGTCVSRSRTRIAPSLHGGNIGYTSELPASALGRSSLWLDLAGRVTITQRIEADGEILGVFVYDLEHTSIDSPAQVEVVSAQQFAHWQDFVPTEPRQPWA